MARGRRRRAIRAAILGAALAGCQREPAAAGAGDAPLASEEEDGRPAPLAPRPAPTASMADPRPLVVFLGDSLTAGFEIEETAAYPALLAERLARDGLPARVINAGVSGDTSAGGLARLDWLLAQEPDALVVALGANDGLRGMDPEVTRANLREVLVRARAAGVPALLVGILVPPSFGLDHARRFAAVYPGLARELEVPLVPFLLEGVAGDPALNLEDGLHPNERGHAVMAETMLPHVRRLVEEARRR